MTQWDLLINYQVCLRNDTILSIVHCSATRAKYFHIQTIFTKGPRPVPTPTAATKCHIQNTHRFNDPLIRNVSTQKPLARLSHKKKATISSLPTTPLSPKTHSDIMKLHTHTTMLRKPIDSRTYHRCSYDLRQDKLIYITNSPWFRFAVCNVLTVNVYRIRNP